MSADLEKAAVAASAQPVKQYGATEPRLLKADGSSGDAEKLPLFLGIWQVSPSKLYNIGLAVYVAWFVIHRLADIAYILTVDARFPSGLGHHYSSESERLASISYTRQTLLCGMLHRICIFSVVIAMILTGFFVRFDTILHTFFASVAAWWEISMIRRCWTFCSNLFWTLVGPFLGLFQRVFQPCLSWCSKFTDRAWNGRLSSDISSRFGFRLSFRQLLFGSLYLTLFATAFFMISAPFMYWSSVINIEFGFSNPLTVSAAKIRIKLIAGVFSQLFGIISWFVFLAVLQYRRGWLIMWSLLMALIIFAQYNIKAIAPMVLGMNNPFPTDNFAVGRGFPWVPTDDKKSPWISLNRIYFKDPSLGSASVQFSTQDKSKGQLTLTQHSNGAWKISRKPPLYSMSSQPVYSETISAVANNVLDGLRSESWTVGEKENARMGVRSGSHLRDKLYGFAHDRKIGIAQIYMVDGSHKDIRANAFVAGAGNSSVIGLFDTLFLGKRGSDSDDDSEGASLLKLVSGDSVIEDVSEAVQHVDMDEEERDRKVPRNSAPTQAMDDDEIVSILAHELAHSALKHLEQGMVAQAISSFLTFATLGWLAHSPLAAATIGLHVPLLHVGACLYEHVVSPPVTGILKLFSDALTRHNEYQADAYAARISETYATALQSSLAKLSVNSNQDPDAPLYYEWLHYDHPCFSRRWAHIEATKKETYGK